VDGFSSTPSGSRRFRIDFRRSAKSADLRLFELNPVGVRRAFMVMGGNGVRSKAGGLFDNDLQSVNGRTDTNGIREQNLQSLYLRRRISSAAALSTPNAIVDGSGMATIWNI
jgi:hypothetical protein